MDYVYLQEREGSHPAPEAGQGHHRNQYPTHTQLQQYPVVPQATQPGFVQYMHPLHGPASLTGHVLASQERITPNPTGMSADELRQRTHEFGNVLGAALQASNPAHYGQDGGDGRHSLPLRVPVTSTTHSYMPNLQAGYHIDALSNPHNPTEDSSHTANTDASSKRKNAADGNLVPDHAVQIPDPQSQRESPSEPSVMVNSRSCQTDPLFEGIADPDAVITLAPDLPDGLVCIEKRDRQGKQSLVVVVTKDLRAGEEFGPYTGDFVKEGLGSCNPCTWEICVRGKTRFYISGATDPNNWMQHVQVARCKEEQNMEAFQFYGDIYFRTTKDIPAGSELKVFYSRDYSKRVGFKMGLEELAVESGSQRFECKDCQCRYTNVKSLLRHLKFEHDKENNPVLKRSSRAKQGPVDGEIINVPVSEKQSSTANREKKTQENVNTTKKVSKDKAKHLKVKFVQLTVTKCETEAADVVDEEDKATQFSCKKCRKHFPSEGHLKEHAAFHLETKALGQICETCGCQCKSARDLQKHLLTHDPNAYKCPMCERYFQRRKSVRRHLRDDHQKGLGGQSGVEELDELTKGFGQVCGVCGLECKHTQELQQHSLSHDPNSFSCSICKRFFQRKKSVRYHLRGHHQDVVNETWNTDEVDELIVPQGGPEDKPRQNHICDVCGQEFEDIKSFKQHVLSHNPNAHQCEHCDMKFGLKKHLLSHVREDHEAIWWKKLIKGSFEEKMSRMIDPEKPSKSVTPTEPFHPDLPQDMLGKQILLDASLPPKKFQCKYCPRMFSRYEGVRCHEKRMHVTSGRYLCEYCSDSFTTETRYLIHKRRHTKAHQFKCEDCPRSFASENALKNHLPEHTGERPYKCDVCGKGHNTKKNMRKHKLRHKKPTVVFHCSFCPKSFRDRTSRQKHEDRHKGIRPFVCMTCGKAFTTNYSMKCHMRIHTGERPFACKICGQRFRVSHFLTAHMGIHERNGELA